MSSQRRIGSIVATAVVALVLIGVGIGLHWSPWIIVVVALVCCAFGALAHLAFNRVPPQPAPLPPPLPAPEPPPAVQMVSLQGVNLASAAPDYEFILDATVYWRPIGAPSASYPHVRPGARAIDAIIHRAADVAAGEEPGMAVRLQHRLNDVLGVAEADPTGRVEVWADQVRTSLSDADAQRLRTLADIRKDEAVWEHQRRFECDKREYLTEDVLRSTGSALVWWLSRNEADVTRAADLIPTMARLSAAARNEDIPTLFRHLLPADLLPPEASRFAAAGSDGAGQPFGFGFVGASRTAVEVLTELMNALRLDDEQRSLFAAQVAANVDAAGNMPAADEIRRRFDVIVDEPEPEPDAATNGAHAWPGASAPAADPSGE